MITFGTLIISFFSTYLGNQKGHSPETIASYSCLLYTTDAAEDSLCVELS